MTYLQLYRATINIGWTFTHIFFFFLCICWPILCPYRAINKSIFVFWQLYVRYFSHLRKWHLKSNKNIYVIGYISFLGKCGIKVAFFLAKYVMFRKIIFTAQKLANIHLAFLQMCKMQKPFYLKFFLKAYKSFIFLCLHWPKFYKNKVYIFTFGNLRISYLENKSFHEI